MKCLFCLSIASPQPLTQHRAGACYYFSMKVPRSIKLIGVFLVLFVLPCLLIVNASMVSDAPEKSASNTTTADPEQPDSNAVAPEPAQTAQPADSGPPKLLIGNPAAGLTIVKYGDFQCPICAQFFRQAEPEIISNYVDTGRVNIEFRVETHIGAESVRAGEAAYCANDQGRFRAYHDELYRRQGGLNSGAFSDANLRQIAASLNLDQTRFASCLQDGKYRGAVEASHREAGARGVTATPTVFIGNNKVVGAQPFSIYKRLIDEQL